MNFYISIVKVNIYYNVCCIWGRIWSTRR